MDIGIEMRATGTAEFIDNPALRDRLFTDKPFLRPLADVMKIIHVKAVKRGFGSGKTTCANQKYSGFSFSCKL